MEKWQRELSGIVKTKIKNFECPYCGSEPQLVKGDIIYPHRRDLYEKSFWLCNKGHEEAYVGCHKNTDKPLGRLADSELRKEKSKTHNIFDIIWRDKFAGRNESYRWLATALSIPVKKCHVGMFDVQQCKMAQLIAKHELDYLRSERSKGYTPTLRAITTESYNND